MLAAGLVLVVAYGLIFSEKMHRAAAAVIGAVVMVGLGSWMGFYTQAQAVHAVDANTMLLLTGMMMLVAMLKPTGGFEYLAIRIAKFAAGRPKVLLVALGAVVSVVSMFLDNVTTVVVFAPLTVLITRLLNLNPLPYLMSEAMLSNIGGVATLVGDPPNIMIGSAAGIDFSRFLFHMGPITAVTWLATTALMVLMFRRELAPRGAPGVVDLDERKAVKDPRTLRHVLFALGVVVVLFFLHHHLGLFPAYVTFIGVSIAFVLLRPEIEPILHEVEWPVLLFFAALFVIVGGVDASGLLALIGHRLAGFATEPGMLLATCLILMWAAAALSAVVDNIPFTVTMIPIVLGLEGQGVNTTPLWWALALGVGLGGNGTHIGATANVICVAESERCGIPEAVITPKIWLRKGLPATVFSLTAASAVFALFFEFFSGGGSIG
ncbi:MAG TPA: citrate transporter [Chromatiales bacterium]|nr:citrate transporter [Chromatiales bacterium]